jgi:hypothetical protein
MECYFMAGGHATTATGAVGILHDRRIRRQKYAGVYCKLTEDGSTWEWLKWAMDCAAASAKNRAGVLMEISARGQKKALQSGGVEADTWWCNQGFCVHQGKGAASRWVVPEPLVDFVAIWIPFSGYMCDELPGFSRGFY